MENKTIGICQVCNKQFEYNLKPGYPRKYCVDCAAKKKAEFEAKGSGFVDVQAPKQATNRETSIVAQCLTKIVFENKVDAKLVLETYRNFVKEL